MNTVTETELVVVGYAVVDVATETLVVVNVLNSSLIR